MFVSIHIFTLYFYYTHTHSDAHKDTLINVYVCLFCYLIWDNKSLCVGGGVVVFSRLISKDCLLWWRGMRATNAQLAKSKNKNLTNIMKDPEWLGSLANSLFHPIVWVYFTFSDVTGVIMMACQVGERLACFGDNWFQASYYLKTPWVFRIFGNHSIFYSIYCIFGICDNWWWNVNTKAHFPNTG